MKQMFTSFSLALLIPLLAPMALSAEERPRPRGAEQTMERPATERRARCPDGEAWNPEERACVDVSDYAEESCVRDELLCYEQGPWQSRLRAGQSVGSMDERDREEMVADSANREHNTSSENDDSTTSHGSNTNNSSSSPQEGSDPDPDEDSDIDDDQDRDG